MNIYCINHKYIYETEKLLMLFFPLEKNNVCEEFHSDNGNYFYTEIEETDEKITFKAIFSYEGKTLSDEKTLLTDQCADKEYELLSLGYPLLRTLCGFSPEWGMLTGVRPSKLIMNKMDEADEKTAKELATIAEINMEELAQNMFQAGSNLKGKTDEEICFQDFKQFTVNDVRFGVGQINSMNKEELAEIKMILKPYLEKAALKQKLDMVFFMLTNIVEESTELLCYGKGAKEQVIEAFDLPADTDAIHLHGVVSRKKQLIPTFVVSLQQ